MIGDKEHIHHRILSILKDQRKTAFLFYLITLSLCTMALLISLGNSEYRFRIIGYASSNSFQTGSKSFFHRSQEINKTTHNRI